jgi:predicted dehydrogenase
LTSITFNLGIIGAGMWGLNYLEALRSDDRARVTWVASASSGSVKNAQEKFGVPNGTCDHREMLKDPGLEAVIISTPPDTHVPMAIAALRAGKHVLIEKPMALNREEARALQAEVEKHPRLVALEASCRHTRLQPKFRFVKNYIDSGKLGQVYHIHHNHLIPTTFVEYNPKGAWAMKKAQAGGGPFFDLGVYDLAFHLGLLDDKPELLAMRAFQRNDLRDVSSIAPGADIEQHGAAWMEFSGGLTYYYERGGGVHAEVANETRIYGTKGSLRFSYFTWDPATIDYYSTDAENKPTHETLTVDFSGHPGNDNIPFASHFLDCLEGKAMPFMPVKLAAKHLDILLRILES